MCVVLGRVERHDMTDLFSAVSKQVSSARPEVASKVPAKARVSDMVLEDKSRRRHAEHGVRNSRRAELVRVREKKTSDAAELLSKALGADGVALLVKAFSEEEWPWDLLSALRRQLRGAVALKTEPDDAAR